MPFDKIRYDNLKSAVSRVLFGRNRPSRNGGSRSAATTASTRSTVNPVVTARTENGGVEGQGGRFRRTHLVPVPKVDSLVKLNTRLEGYDRADDARRIANRTRTVGADFALEHPLLQRLPAEPFGAGLWLTSRVDRHARVMVRQCQYSVPARFIGRRVRVRLGASDLVVLDGRTGIASHARSVQKGSQTMLLDHYLEVLVRKPGALPGSTALAQARKQDRFTSAHEAFWAAARKRHGDAVGTRALVEVLLLHRHLAFDDVIAGLTAAVSGATSADVVAVEARLHANLADPAADRAAGRGKDRQSPTPQGRDLRRRGTGGVADRTPAAGLPAGSSALAHRRPIRRTAAQTSPRPHCKR
ncbi:hypothetical protein JOD67_006704 [Tenggerimyces flavus]|nr:hypothetical protein [Tenggerimyces flavus]